MKAELRDICRREITRINKLSEESPLKKDDIERLKSLATALKTLEDTQNETTDEDSIARASLSELYNILDRCED